MYAKPPSSSKLLPYDKSPFPAQNVRRQGGKHPRLSIQCQEKDLPAFVSSEAGVRGESVFCCEKPSVVPSDFVNLSKAETSHSLVTFNLSHFVAQIRGEIQLASSPESNNIR
jgi:hypothetical protein